MNLFLVAELNPGLIFSSVMLYIYSKLLQYTENLIIQMHDLILSETVQPKIK